jgi:ketosteroid isomerase-like protein
MSTESNKDAKLRYFDAFNRRDLTAFDGLFAAEYVLHPTGFPEVRGADELTKLVLSSLDTLAEARLIADDMVAEGDKVAISGITIDRFVDGKIAEAWETFDLFGLMRQLGVTS